MWDDFFRGKKITLMGLGLLGRGVGDAVFFAQHGADLIVTDMKSAEELATSVEQLASFSNITFRLGGHELEDFRGRDMIIRAANVPASSPFLEEARTENTLIEQSVSLFVQVLREYKKSVGRGDEKYLVGVTGSKGKTTVTHLIYEMLAHAFPEKRVRMGGNVQGISTLAYLNDLKPDDIFVLELDSWQLQSFGDRRMSPHVSVFTTFLPDHMNYYLKVAGGNVEEAMKQYFNDKAQIFCFQGERDVCFVGENVVPWVEKHHATHAPRVRRSKHTVFSNRPRSLQGAHNEENIALAADVAGVFGVPESVVAEVVATCKGVPGRLQFVLERDGISYYNDTTATMPEATMAALRALSPKSKVQNRTERTTVLIMGGADKELPTDALVAMVPEHVRALVLLKGTGTDRIRGVIRDSDFDSVVEVSSMREAVAAAQKVARNGDSILLSPAFASFGMFVNEYDRGEQFLNEVKKDA